MFPTGTFFREIWTMYFGIPAQGGTEFGWHWCTIHSPTASQTKQALGFASCTERNATWSRCGNSRILLFCSTLGTLRIQDGWRIRTSDGQVGVPLGSQRLWHTVMPRFNKVVSPNTKYQIGKVGPTSISAPPPL